ncbi:MAG: adenosylmethionine--8-amino-7-oxononanoate transaminase [Anaerolineaceae bacterium]|nr:adenosylmethionine--8-amino-7-oxononanoate transaminase [Anaerolineaceae bacterium]
MAGDPLYGQTPDRLRRLDTTVLWHPFTQMAEYREPLLIVEAEGNYLFDSDGRRYFDGVSSLWCNLHGHRRPEINRAISEQLDRVAHTTLLGLGSPPSIELARRLTELAPGDLNHVFYSDSGSTAVEAALKIAFQYQSQKPAPEPRRKRFVALGEAYHGDTLGSVSVGGIGLFHEAYGPLLFDVHRVPAPHCYRCPLNLERRTCNLACAEEMDRIVDEQASELAAFVIEPLVQGAAGMIVHPPGYLKRVGEACRRAGCLLIADEVAVGFGRTGTMFACQQELVVPDLMCLAKGITGGYLPLAATLARDHVYQAFLAPREARRTFYHGHTYTGNALAAVAALAGLDIFQSDRVLEHLPEKIERMARALDKLRSLGHVGDLRQKGLMVGIELVADTATRQAYPYEQAVGQEVCRAARARGLILRPLGDVIVLMPPLSITSEEIDSLVETTAAAIGEVTG